MTGGHEPGCARPAGHLAHYPCGGPLQGPGDPCEFCGAATPADGGACLRCWPPVTIAAFKAYFARATVMDFPV
jgi:hypothetical protein